MIREIRFISQNQHKIKEVGQILSGVGVKVKPTKLRIEELQTQDVNVLIRDKALKAFDQIRRPLCVEHTGIYIKYLNDFPGGLTQIFWDTLQADRFAELFGNTPDTGITAKTTIGYIDGNRLHIFDGTVTGHIAPNPRGIRDFQWDCIFIPDGYEETFAELGAKKNQISMRRKALDAFVEFLKKGK